LNGGKQVSASLGSFGETVRTMFRKRKAGNVAVCEISPSDSSTVQQPGLVVHVPVVSNTEQPKRVRAEKKVSRPFSITSLLRLRTFVYLIGGTVFFGFQIHNTLAIINLSRQNELIREQLRISTSINTAQNLRVSELQSINNISGTAVSLGLCSSAVPPVEINP
jgi:hypothetical protein